MEYCGGGSVADLVHAADGPLDQDIIAYLCAETLSGLTYLHAIGKVPRRQPPRPGHCGRSMGTKSAGCCCRRCPTLNAASSPRRV